MFKILFKQVFKRNTIWFGPVKVQYRNGRHIL